MKRSPPNLALVFAVTGALFGAACGGSDSASTAATQPAKIAKMATPAVIVQAPSATPPPQLCLVTRERGVGESYVPPDLVVLPRDYTLGSNIRLRREVAQAAIKLIDAAWEEGHKILAESGFRSYQDQASLMTDVARRAGREQAERQVAPAGHSEHQLGLAMDVGIVRRPFTDDPAFGSWPEGLWLAANAARFGFLISYPAGKEHITGYPYEPWHVRYVGVPLAQQILDSGQTLTEYLLAHDMAACEPQQPAR